MALRMRKVISEGDNVSLGIDSCCIMLIGTTDAVRHLRNAHVTVLYISPLAFVAISYRIQYWCTRTKQGCTVRDMQCMIKYSTIVYQKNSFIQPI